MLLHILNPAIQRPVFVRGGCVTVCYIFVCSSFHKFVPLRCKHNSAMLMLVQAGHHAVTCLAAWSLNCIRINTATLCDTWLTEMLHDKMTRFNSKYSLYHPHFPPPPHLHPSSLFTYHLTWYLQYLLAMNSRP